VSCTSDSTSTAAHIHLNLQGTTTTQLTVRKVVLLGPTSSAQQSTTVLQAALAAYLKQWGCTTDGTSAASTKHSQLPGTTTTQPALQRIGLTGTNEQRTTPYSCNASSSRSLPESRWVLHHRWHCCCQHHYTSTFKVPQQLNPRCKHWSAGDQ
jgi:hypothetical protein